MVNFITFGTDNCEELLSYFYDNLLKFCPEDFTLHYYSINYKSSLVGEYFINHVFETNKNFERGFDYKPYIILKSMIDIPNENLVYLDLDIMLTKNFSSKKLFDSIKLSKTPLAPNHYWEHPFNIIKGEKLEDGERLSKHLGITLTQKYLQACMIVYNKNHFEFLCDWISLTDNPEIFELTINDEEILNILLHKYNQPNSLGYICISRSTVIIEDKDDMESIKLLHSLYQEDKFDKLYFIKQNNFYKNLDVSNIMVFHGIKN